MENMLIRQKRIRWISVSLALVILFFGNLSVSASNTAEGQRNSGEMTEMESETEADIKIEISGGTEKEVGTEDVNGSTTEPEAGETAETVAEPKAGPAAGNSAEIRNMAAGIETKPEAETETESSPPVMVTVLYKAGTGGKISGDAVQEIEKGGKTSIVTAKANSGYVFSRWSDGATVAARSDMNVTASKTVTAMFERKATKVTLNKTKITLGVGETFTLKAKVAPASAAQKVTWSSSKATGVFVSAGGKLTPRKAGKFVVTATGAGGKTKTCTVTVKKAPKKVKVKPASRTIKKGKSFKIKVSFKPKKAGSNKITFSSNKKSVAKVNSKGKVTAKKKGKAVITVKAFNGKKGKVKVKVK